MKNSVYEKVKSFKQNYPVTVAWRLRSHSKIAQMHLNPDEEVIDAFAAQKNDNPIDLTTTSVIVLTNKRIMIAQKRVIFGYFLKSITPDMFNDLTVKMGIVWGKIYIDTVKEFVKFSNIQREALPVIETAITSYMMEAKKSYPQNKAVNE